MFRPHRIRLAAAALVVGVAVAVPIAAAAATKPANPVITRLSPPSAKPMHKVFVDGRDFMHVRSVKVDGLKAAFKVDSARKITVTVPKAAKTGRVEVITKAGTALSRERLRIV
jgi:hypothetical protein